jgi:hypothetical protein
LGRSFRALGARGLVVTIVAAVLVPLSSTPAAQATDPCGPPVTSVIACENSKPGTPPNTWQVTGSGDAGLQGFATQMSVNKGETVNFKISSVVSYHYSIVRLGWYQGNGARQWASNLTPSAPQPQIQPSCLTDPNLGLVDCGNWSLSASWVVPPDAVSGVYLAILRRDDTGAASQIPFIVRDDSSHSDIVVQTSDTTWEAYNQYGGFSLYDGANSQGRAYKVSYNRPFTTATDQGNSWWGSTELEMWQWLERNGYDVSYITGADTDRSGALLLNHKVFMSVGHDEYWSGQQRANVDAAKAAGVNLAFFSGNEMYWKTRWEPSVDGNNTAYRTLVTYKETIGTCKYDETGTTTTGCGRVIDPQDPPTWTGTWRDTRFSPPGDGGRPENATTGQESMVTCCQETIQVPAADGKMRLWRNTVIANLAPGATASLTPGTLGYEWDVDVDNGSRPPGIVWGSTTQATEPNTLEVYGETTGPANVTHHLTMYKAPSGALVFDAGTMQWSWNLLGTSSAGPNVSAEQATVNLLADMGAQPATPQSDLTPATASTDTTPPTSTITAPAPGTVFAQGSTVNVTGTAVDTGGGVVGGVEVSTDGGSTWHPTTGRESWSYTGAIGGTGPVRIMSRAVDDSGNIETPNAGIGVTVNCPCSLFPNTTVPPNPDAADGNAVELGVQFHSEVSGFVTGVRFYKGTTNTGTHIGSLWTSTGTLLASATFSGESASGWQTVSFSSPVPIAANTTYVASYHTNVGQYAYDSMGLTNPVDLPPLHAAAASGASPNGVYLYSATSAFPTSASKGSNYFVDAVFTTNGGAGPPAVSSTVPTANASGVALTTPVSARFNEPVQGGSVSLVLKDPSNNTVPATLSFDVPSNTATLTPNAPLAYSTTYTATVSGVLDTSGTPMTGPYSWSFTTVAPPSCPCNIFGNATPSVSSVSDGSSVELGVKLRSDVAGFVTGVRFYKGSGNTGTHIGNLWTSSGTLLATATFSGETGSGWQTVSFGSPVPVAANTTYVASYFAPNGHYAFTAGGLSSAVDNAPLHALANGTDGANAVFLYSASSAFPSSVSNGSNYYVDAVFTTQGAAGPPVVSATVPAANATGVALNTVVSATFNKPVQGGSVAFVLKDPSNNTVPATLSFDVPSNTAKLTPSAPLAQSTTYTATVSGVLDTSGTPMAAPYSWSFTTDAGPSCPCNIFGNAIPTVASVGDPNAVELGVKFRTDTPGFVTGVRFYKGPTNTGTHIGSLWTSTGTLLASATFSGESASGWQTVSFSSPVPIVASTTYIASYHTNVGGYAFTAGGLSSAVDNPPLHALANGTDGANAVYAYSASSTFPSSASNGSNYFVDATFTTTGTVGPPTVSATVPAANATGVALNTVVSATFNKPVQGPSVAFVLKDPSNNTVPATLSFDAPSNTATLTPSAPLNASTTYTATVSGVLDTSGTPMAAPYSWSFTTVAPPSCPCNIFGNATPTVASVGDPNAVELGVKFRTDTPGFVTGVRFYKGAANTGTHIGNLWTSTGTLLASATFSGESASGWQTVTFSSPVPVAAGTTYVASYHTNVGGYAFTAGGLSSAVDNPPLHALANGTDGANGVYGYSASTAFPSSASNGSNYFVDAIFNTTGAAGPPTVSATVPAANATGVALNTMVSATFNKPVQGPSVAMVLKDPSNNTVPATLSFDVPSNTATLTPNAPLAQSTMYTATVSGVLDTSGTPMAAPYSWSFTTVAPPSCPCNIFGNATPTVTSVSDPSSVELGVKFRTDTPGFVTGVRFYKGATNTGTHIGNLWTRTGTLLGTATFSGESASGWQTVSFSSPVPVAANTTYIASYFAPNGHYAFTAGGLSSAVDNPPLHALANGTDGANAVFGYSASTAFPTSASNGSNYFVDAVFNTTGTAGPPTVSATVPAANATGVALNTVVSATFNKPVQGGSVAMVLKDPSNNTVPATLSFDVPSNTATLTPSAPLVSSTVYTATVSGVLDTSGTPMAGPYSWSFTTVAPPSCPCNIFGTATPSVASVPDGNAIELGVKFRSDSPGFVTGVRFYKGSTNTGTHIGNLWTSTGTLLATATFTGESGSGWQQVTFGSSIPVAANTTYIASYFAPNGHYAFTAGGLSSAVDNPPLHALANGTDGANGVYAYGGSSGFPSSASNGSNYYVDVVFDRNGPASPHSIWSALADPAVHPNNSSFSDTNSVEVGVKFRSDVAGSVTGVRFYKGAGNTGTHVGDLWSSTGAHLATVTFTNETASGWQEAAFAIPVVISPNTTYIISYFAPNGHYASDPNYFDAPGSSFADPPVFDNPPLHALAAGVDGPNGVFSYSATPAFPTSSHSDTNYWVDVVFSAGLPAPTVTLQSPASNATNVGLSSTVSATFSQQVQPGNISFTLVDGANNPVSAALSYTTSTRTAVLDPNLELAPNTTYRATLSATDLAGTPMNAPLTWTFTTTATPEPPPSVQGQWAPRIQWPNVAIATTVLNTGKVMTWDEIGPDTPTPIYDPATQTFSDGGDNQTGFWCGGQVHMADGRIMLFGGNPGSFDQGTKVVMLYNPATNTWTRAADMHLPRWYGSGVRLADGRILVIAGNTTDDAHWADTPEVYDPNTNTWTLLPGIDTSQIHEQLYASMYLMADGRVFVWAGSTGQSFYLDVNAQTITPGPTSPVFNGVAVQYAPGKVLVTGGTAMAGYTTGYGTAAVNRAAVIDLNSPTPAWRSVAPMHYARSQETLLSLADGRVMAMGGGITFSTSEQTGILPAEIFDPTTEQWSVVTGPMQDYRMNHSTAVLLPDGRVLAAGGGHDPGQVDFYSGEIYSPPYLFNGPRPTITSAPASAALGAQLAIQTPNAANIAKVSLNALGAITHQFNDDANYQELPFTKGAGSVTATLPTNGNILQPGDYFLTIVDTNGIPSTSNILHVSGSSLTVTNGEVTGVDGTDATISWTTSQPATSYVQYGLTEAYGSSTAPTTQTTQALSGLLPNSTYHFRVVSTAADGSVAYSPDDTFSNNVCPCSIWGASATPAVTATSDLNSVEVGVKFQADRSGVISGIRFYKGTGNNGPHTVSLWTAGGTSLATATSSSETASGWQEVDFSSPVAIAANTTYVASYHASSGHYADDASYFTNAFDNSPLHGLANGISGGNGVFSYGTGPTFPTSTINSSNYWVDVVFS